MSLYTSCIRLLYFTFIYIPRCIFRSYPSQPFINNQHLQQFCYKHSLIKHLLYSNSCADFLTYTNPIKINIVYDPLIKSCLIKNKGLWPNDWMPWSRSIFVIQYLPCFDNASTDRVLIHGEQELVMARSIAQLFVYG